MGVRSSLLPPSPASLTLGTRGFCTWPERLGGDGNHSPPLQTGQVPCGLCDPPWLRQLAGGALGRAFAAAGSGGAPSLPSLIPATSTVKLPVP